MLEAVGPVDIAECHICLFADHGGTDRLVRLLNSALKVPAQLFRFPLLPEGLPMSGYPVPILRRPMHDHPCNPIVTRDVSQDAVGGSIIDVVDQVSQNHHGFAHLERSAKGCYRAVHIRNNQHLASISAIAQEACSLSSSES